MDDDAHNCQTSEISRRERFPLWFLTPVTASDARQVGLHMDFHASKPFRSDLQRGGNK